MSLEDFVDGTVPGCKGMLPDNSPKQPHETLPPVEEYEHIPVYDGKSKCEKCGHHESTVEFCDGKKRFMRKTCKHNRKGQHHLLKCERCSFSWVELCREPQQEVHYQKNGILREYVINDLWAIVRLTDQKIGDETVETRLQRIKEIAQILNGYVNLI